MSEKIQANDDKTRNVPAPNTSLPPEPSAQDGPSREELDACLKAYKEIRSKWQKLTQTQLHLSDAQFDPGDYEKLNKLLLEFARHMSHVFKELDVLDRDLKSQVSAMILTCAGNMLSGSLEDYQTITNQINELVEIFDKAQPHFEKLVEFDDAPVFSVSDIKKMGDLLEEAADIIVKNKGNIEKDMEPSSADPDKTVMMRPVGAATEVSSQEANMSAVHAIVRKLVEAANRMDLRAPSQQSKTLLGELLSYLKALRECYQAMHWVSRGEAYYADHELFGSLYSQLASEVDDLAEKAIGYTDDAYVVDVQYQTARVAAHVTEIMSFLPDMTNIQCMLNAERKLTKELMPKMLNDLEQAGELSDGLENFLQDIADSHEKTMYHLQRRLKTHKDLGEQAPVEPNISPPPAPVDNVDQEFDDMLDQGVV